MIVRKLFLILCNRDMRVILYKLHFLSPHFSSQPKKWVFHPSNQKQMRETKIFSILLLFYPSTFSSPQPNRPLRSFSVKINSINSSSPPRLTMIQFSSPSSLFHFTLSFLQLNLRWVCCMCFGFLKIWKSCKRGRDELVWFVVGLFMICFLWVEKRFFFLGVL